MMPARALDKLSRIIALQIEDGGASRKAVTTPSPEQLTLFDALVVELMNSGSSGALAFTGRFAIKRIALWPAA
jgi:hypothetical protein